ncbi:MAG: hypothetical protein ABJD68_06205 [Nakamurella sp.]
MDLGDVAQRVGYVESMLSDSVSPAANRRKLLCVHELDRLAESLVGEPDTEAQEIKNRIQVLLTQAAPHRRDATAYSAIYCHGPRP